MRLSSGAAVGGAIQLFLRAERRQVAEAIREGAEALAQALEAQGLRLGSINVSSFRQDTGMWFGTGSAGGPAGWSGGRGMDGNAAPGLFRPEAEAGLPETASGPALAATASLAGWGRGGRLDVLA